MLVSTPVIMLSTYMLSAIWWAMGVPALVRWFLIVVANRNGLHIIPNETLLNLSTWTLFSRVGLEGSLNHRNLVTFRSSGGRPTWRKASSTSATSNSLWSLNLKRRSHISSNMTGPRWKLSLRLWFFFLVFAEASKTILSLLLSSLVSVPHGVECSVSRCLNTVSVSDPVIGNWSFSASLLVM